MNKLTILISLITVVYIALDFEQRFLSNIKQPKAMQQQDVQDMRLNPPQLTVSQKQRIQRAFDLQYAETETSATTVQGLEAAQQSQQQGRLTQLYIGDWLYELTAIVYPESQAKTVPFAILNATNVKTSAIKVEKVNNASQLGSYKVTIEGTKQVSFEDTKQDRTVLLVMYKSTPATDTK